jgi:hypothetical protein
MACLAAFIDKTSMISDGRGGMRFAFAMDDMVDKKETKKSRELQSEKFFEAARSLECDESEERFDAALRKIAAHKPPKGSETGAHKSEAKPSKETR